tara:strand:- start:245 stop:1495 length:1251 start_codon:yes stop_codon:yes gene_type:complete
MSQTEVQLIKADAVQTGDIADSAVTDAKISGVASSKLTGALPAISGAALTNLPASGKAHNLINNGAMLVAQRGVSSTSTMIQTVDRFKAFWTGQDENPTQAQGDVAAGTTPYTLGFRKTFKLTNGNQTSGAGATDYFIVRTVLEAQDIANSGWNYVSSSSNITLSFWIKSSVAQNFYGNLLTSDGTQYNYRFETGSLTADTWTKITKTIPGNSNLQFDNDANAGLSIQVNPYMGTDYTAQSGDTPLGTWAAFSGSTIQPDNTSTWWTTNDATLEFTGFQLEVGSVATDFEHRSFGQELALCQRYFYLHADPSEAGGSDNEVIIGQGCYYGNPDHFTTVFFPVRMRTTPTLVQNTGSNYYVIYRNNGADYSTTVGTLSRHQSNCCTLYDSSASGTAGQGTFLSTYKAGARVSFSAEL